MMSLIPRVEDAIVAGHIPLALAIEWEERGCAAWEASVDARIIVRLLVHTDRRAAVMAVAACVRTVLDFVADRRPWAAVEAAERWARDPTPMHAKYAGVAADDAMSAVTGSVVSDEAVRAAAYTADVVAPVARRVSGAAEAAVRAAARAATGEISSDGVVPNKRFDAVVKRFAALIRRVAPCPTIDEIIRAASEG